ncbi:hypothetical protein DPX16_20266 [Anabarilius grahami]|uniref:Uncharacterized protein n=1 Tax=Anabarilius grahami TaxID=495550 RepID=A0A3N0XEI2_ANAGA|nr:hypothetical protein DPX16_20266 [Anabarilius grahami]
MRPNFTGALSNGSNEHPRSIPQSKVFALYNFTQSDFSTVIQCNQAYRERVREEEQKRSWREKVFVSGLADRKWWQRDSQGHSSPGIRNAGRHGIPF